MLTDPNPGDWVRHIETGLIGQVVRWTRQAEVGTYTCRQDERQMLAGALLEMPVHTYPLPIDLRIFVRWRKQQPEFCNAVPMTLPLRARQSYYRPNDLERIAAPEGEFTDDDFLPLVAEV